LKASKIICLLIVFQIVAYWEAMNAEISTLSKIKAWKFVPFKSNMNDLDSTWHSNAPDILMVVLESSRLVSGVEETRKYMVHTILILSHQ